MSTYHYIYGGIDDRFFEIRCVSSSFLCIPTADIPFEKLARITESTLSWWKENLNHDIECFEKEITDANQRIEYMVRMEGSLNERMEVINETMMVIDTLKEDILRRRSELEFTEFLWTMLESNSEDEFRLYQGYEICNPTLEDIERDN